MLSERDKHHRFPVEIISHGVWLYYRFTLSLRDVEELLAERGIEVTYETIRQWGIQFGPAIARDLRSRRPRPHSRWHMDEMFVSIGGSGCICGEPLITRAKFSIAWSNPDATSEQPQSSCGNC